MRPPSGSIMGLEGGLFSRYLRIMTTHGRSLAPTTGAGGRPFVPEMRIMATTMVRNMCVQLKYSPFSLGLDFSCAYICLASAPRLFARPVCVFSGMLYFFANFTYVSYEITRMLCSLINRKRERKAIV